MNLDEAITHCLSVSKRCSGQCSMDHIQLAKWLADLKPNTPENKKYLEMCEKWTKVTIAIKRNEHSHTFVHHFFGKVPNTKKEEMARDIELWRKLRELASDKKDRRYAKLGLKVIVSKYESTPDFIEMEAGYGKLFPMVKTEDYEKAKRELE